MSKRTELRERRRRKQIRHRVTLYLFLGGIVLVFAAVILLPYLRPVGEIVIPERIDRPMTAGTGMGDPNAPVLMEEFSDFECGYCRRHSETTELELMEQYIRTGKVYLVFRHFPLYDPSQYAAEASLCAAEQGKFWEYHDILYANQSASDPFAFSQARLQAFAEAIGLDSAQFRQCVEERRYVEAIEKDQQAGEAAGIQGTPSFLINGELVVGAYPLEFFQEKIEAALEAIASE